ncbi:MAG: sulfite exporter TauE/SafE family protein [Myxococcota bacterium]|nr:sulfite exporter TauE/SafE family protein [Myxococcota bacterium]
MPDALPILLFASVAVFLAQVVKGISGFGSALVAVLLLNWVYPPDETVFLSASVDLLSGAWMTLQLHKRIDWRLVLALFFPLLLGQAGGTSLLVSLPVPVLKVLAGGVIAALGVGWILRPVRPGLGALDARPVGDRRLLMAGGLAGLFGGFMGGVIGAAGPPLILFMKRSFTDRFLRAQLVGTFFLGAITMLGLLAWHGTADLQVLRRIPWILPAALAGNLLGSWLSERVPRALFARLTGVLLALAGSGLVVQVLRGL